MDAMTDFYELDEITAITITQNWLICLICQMS